MFSFFTRGVAAMALLSGAGCQRYLFQFQPASTVVGKQIDITVDRPSEADILFVIDSSGSMQAHQDNLRANIRTFIETLATSPQKFQIGVTTTDYGDCTDVAPSPNPWDGKCGRLFSPDGADPVMRRTDYQDNNDGLIARFQQIVEAVGTNGTGYEQGLKAAVHAVEPRLTAPGAPNANFLRPSALLGVVFVSDEWDCSFSDDPQLGSSIFWGSSLPEAESCYAYADKLESVKNWAARITAVKGRASLVAVGQITAGMFDTVTSLLTPGQCSVGSDGNPTNACSCFYAQPLAFCAYTAPATPPAGESSYCQGSACCRAMGNPRYTGFADYFRLRFADSICRSNYKETLAKIADILKRDCFPLEDGPAGGREDWITVERRAVDTENFLPVPQISADVGFSGDGWFLFKDKNTTDGVPVVEVCLAGSYKRVIGDSYKIKYTAEVNGLDSDIPAQ
jgi:hypothetical protein